VSSRLQAIGVGRLGEAEGQKKEHDHQPDRKKAGPMETLFVF
jgi:hypothetical protein